MTLRGITRPVAGIVSFHETPSSEYIPRDQVVADIVSLMAATSSMVSFQEEGQADSADTAAYGRPQRRAVLRSSAGRAGVELARPRSPSRSARRRGVALRGMGVPVEAALDKLRRVLKVLAQIVFGDVEDLRFDVLPMVGVVHQLFGRLPGSDLLKLLMVHHHQLTAYLEIQLGDMVVNRVLSRAFPPADRTTDAFHKHLHRRGETAPPPAPRKLSSRKVVDIPEPNAGVRLKGH